MQAHIGDAGFLDMAKARGDPVQERLDADEARIGTSLRLPNQMLAAAKTDFKDKLWARIGQGWRGLGEAELLKSGRGDPCPKSYIAWPCRPGAGGEKRVQINWPPRIHGQIRQQRFQERGLARLQLARLGAPETANGAVFVHARHR